MVAAGTSRIWSKWFTPEVVPIFGIVGVACTGAGYYLWKLANGNEVVWDRHTNQRPWEKVDQLKNGVTFGYLDIEIVGMLADETQSKFLTINHEFWEKRRTDAANKTRMVDAI